MRFVFALIALLAFAFVACSDDEAEVSDLQVDGPPPIEGPTFTTERGVQVTVIATGSEEDPSGFGDNVAVHYTGWLADGTEFDSSLGGEPFTFILGAGQVIQGWDEGVTGMSPGEQRRLIIPPDLAYGDQGAGNVIPPGATLTFDVELVAFGRRVPATPDATD